MSSTAENTHNQASSNDTSTKESDIPHNKNIHAFIKPIEPNNEDGENVNVIQTIDGTANNESQRDNTEIPNGNDINTLEYGEEIKNDDDTIKSDEDDTYYGGKMYETMETRDMNKPRPNYLLPRPTFIEDDEDEEDMIITLGSQGHFYPDDDEVDEIEGQPIPKEAGNPAGSLRRTLNLIGL